MNSSLPLCEWSATNLLVAYQEKTLSPVEVMRSVIGRIEQSEPALQATFLFRPEAAIEQAAQSAQRWLSNKPKGVLDGVPVTIKENLATQGDLLPMGTKGAVHANAAVDSPPAARLREAGAITVSKTTMPDFGMLTSGLSSFHTIARNPWDVQKTPGGSSAGAGSAAAAGYGPLHIGTDIGGSVRLPAGWCGVFGHKPSLGRIPIDPPFIGRVAGPMTRTVSDAALMMSVLSLPDARDSMGLPYVKLDWLAGMSEPESLVAMLKGKKMGLLQNAGCGLAVDSQITQCIAKAADLFAQAGAIVEPMAPFMTQEMLTDLDAFWRMRAYFDLQRTPAALREQVLPFIAAWAQGAANFTGERMYRAASASYQVRVATVKACSAYDFVLSPVVPVLAFDATQASPKNDPVHALEHIGFTVPMNMSEQPAASVNCGYVLNENARYMPVGLQIIGQRFDDLGVMRVARAFELLRAPQRPWPVL
jgi:aspartyl-tRNA(Asn)/glutamyl-tRNA(Gln) amidotransferase subunit A